MEITRGRPHRAGLSTHHSAADVSSRDSSYCAVVRNRLATSGRRRDDKPLCQVAEWLIHSEQQRDGKAPVSGQSLIISTCGGYSNTNIPISSVNLPGNSADHTHIKEFQ